MRGWGQEKLDVWLGELRIFCDQILFLQKNQNDYKKTNFMPISNPLRKLKKYPQNIYQRKSKGIKNHCTQCA